MKKLIAAAFALAALAAAAQTVPAPQNVLQLSASGSVEVPQDLVTTTLSTTRTGSDAAPVQAQLKSALDAALADVRRSAQAGDMDVHTGGFNVSPRYSNGARDGWQGTAELVLKGRDFARIAQTAGRVSGMTVSSINFGLSRDSRERAESDAQKIAIERFRAKAGELAKGFGFSGYGLREVQVSSNDATPGPRVMYAAAPAMARSDAPVPIEAGRSTVTVTVSGSVQLQ